VSLSVTRRVASPPRSVIPLQSRAEPIFGSQRLQIKSPNWRYVASIWQPVRCLVCVCVCVCVACPILGGLLCLSVCSLPLMDNLPRSACHVTTPIGSLHAADKRPGPGLPSRGSRQAGRPLPLQPPHCGWVGFDVGGVRIKLAAWRYFVPHATPVQFVRWSHFERFISGPRHATNRLETGRRPVINNIRTCRRLAHCFSRRPTY